MEAMVAMNKAVWRRWWLWRRQWWTRWRHGSYEVAFLVNVCVDIVDVVGRVVDEDLVVSGCVDVIGRVADGAFGGGYESEELWTGISWLCVDVVDVVGRVVDGDLMVSGCVDVVDVSGRVVDGALGGGYESGKRDGGDSGSSDSNGGGN
ncbi:hypothetical protein F2Q68_00029310 [Brassica cretica]|uniref:Uncharacterized protein n=1 Tax=Brassica cretica TaxID=69181 RepID=A0A8S9GDH5_BRACR|nr:hypothetical protein F2Q68_00029310 [Brassica cretica]